MTKASLPGELARGPVAITGFGAVSSVGKGAGAIWHALAAGEDGIRPIERFRTEGFSVRTAALVPEEVGGAPRKTEDLALDFALAAVREAAAAARLDTAPVPTARVAIVFGTSLATHAEGIHRLAEITGDQVGARGPRITISTACSSSANAIGLARDMLLDGVADVVLAGGSDALTEEIFAGFHNLGLLTPGKCAPFSDSMGTTLGEGAGFLVLERADQAQSRGVSPLAWISGHGLSCDAFHATSPDPTGAGVARAARAALADAGLSPADIDYVNAHGTGTDANDPAEWSGLSQVLGERAAKVPVSSTKSVLGHGQGAAGALELIATLLAMQHGAIPQTLHHSRARPRCPDDPVAQKLPRELRVRHALCDSSAFGGANSILAIDARDCPSPSRTVVRREVRLLGVGLVLPGIGDVAAFRQRGDHESLRGRITASPPKSLAGASLRGFDPTSRFLTFATAEALRDACLPLRGPLRDRAGLFAALARISAESAHELDASVKERGLLRLSAPAFTRVVLNAGPGACARSLQLRGPTTTLTTGAGGGLTALVLACDHLASRADADVICVAAADEMDPQESPSLGVRSSISCACEAGACLVLGTPDMAVGSVPSIRVAGWGLAGPHEASLAVARALAMAGLDSELAPDEGGPHVPAPATSPLLRACHAALRLRAGESSAVLLAHAGASCAAAVVLARGAEPS